MGNSQTGIVNPGTLLVGGSVTVVQNMTAEQQKEFKAAFEPVAAAIASEQTESAETATLKLEELKSALEKGKVSGAEDKKVAGLLENIQKLAPKAATALVSAFATPILKVLTGTASEFVLDKMREAGLGT